MEQHNHLARPEPRDALRTASYRQSIAEHTDAPTRYLAHIAASGARLAHMQGTNAPAPGAQP
ncbi:MAG TPA: hypothetical protein VKZ94_11440 [Advenella sp.]|nr:hypothetical protein [Advenella sp.]